MSEESVIAIISINEDTKEIVSLGNAVIRDDYRIPPKYINGSIGCPSTLAVLENGMEIYSCECYFYSKEKLYDIMTNVETLSDKYDLKDVSGLPEDQIKILLKRKNIR